MTNTNLNTHIRKMNAEACLNLMLHPNFQPWWGTNKTTYMVMSWDQYSWQSHNINTDNRWNSSNIWEKPYLIKILFRKKLRADKSGNACYHLVQNLLSSTLLSKNIQIKIHRTIIFPVVLFSHWRRNIGWQCLRVGC